MKIASMNKAARQRKKWQAFFHVGIGSYAFNPSIIPDKDRFSQKRESKDIPYFSSRTLYQVCFGPREPADIKITFPSSQKYTNQRRKSFIFALNSSCK